MTCQDIRLYASCAARRKQADTAAAAADAAAKEAAPEVHSSAELMERFQGKAKRVLDLRNQPAEE